MEKETVYLPDNIFQDYELSDKERALLTVLNEAFSLEAIKYDTFNVKMQFNIHDIMKIEKHYPKLGVTSKGQLTTLTIIATITDYLVDKRLSVLLDDNNYIIGFAFLRPEIYTGDKNVCCNNGW